MAQALDIKQQTVSSLLRRAVPSRDLARLIEAGTGVAWGGWFTRREHDAWNKRLARARSLGAVAH